MMSRPTNVWFLYHRVFVFFLLEPRYCTVAVLYTLNYNQQFYIILVYFLSVSVILTMLYCMGLCLVLLAK